MDFDFLIIGGGIAGASVGAALSALGKVCLWEREAALGYHASGRSAALFEQNYGAPAVVELNKASAAAHFDGGYTTKRGLLFVGTKAQQHQLAEDIQLYELEPMAAGRAHEIVPILDRDALCGAGYHPEAYDLDTDRMVHDAARTIHASGGVIEMNRPVDHSFRTSGGWLVRSGKTVVTTRILVNAAGAWADEVAKIASIEPIGITPYRRSMARLAAPGGHDTKDWPMVIGAGETWYAKPDAGALLVSPAEEEPSAPMDAYADDLVLAEGLARYQEAVTPEVTRPIATWAGLRSFAPDRCLVLGPAPQDRSFVWCAGQGGYGFQTAPAASAFVADAIAGRPFLFSADTTAALTPERFS